MMFKRPKEEIADEVYYRVNSSLRTTMYETMIRSYGHQPEIGPVLESLLHAVSIAMREATKTIIENVYTDAEFEEDIGLTKKD